MDPKPVYHARNSAEATMVQHWLEDAGIKATVLGGEMQGGAFEIVEADPVVIVAGEDFESAVAAIEKFREELQSGTSLDEMSEAEGQFDWPMCPQCDELREATCNNCQKTSNEFSEEITDEGRQTFCLACSEAVEITYSDLCRFCQHDFTASHTRDVSATDPAASEISVNTNRVILVIALIGVLFIAIAILFATSTR
jgi:hypothetical protein